MSPSSYVFQLESELGDSEHTILEREVADIIIYLLHRQDFQFPRWTNKRKRSVNHPLSFAGQSINSHLNSPKIESLESCPNMVRDDNKTGFLEYEERGFVYWREREFVVPDLNISAERMAAAEDEMRRREEEVCRTACRRMAAAVARRKRRDLQRMKNCIAEPDAALCSRVIG